jgi:glucan 1,3-beta-glucosidase
MTHITLLCGVIVALLASSYGQSTIYGVNIGGWLVLEEWIVPSLFQQVGNNRIVDEWTWGQYGGSTTLLQNHWDTWLTQTDLKNLKNAGITHIRIPIGYWIVCTEQELKSYNEPYITGSWPYLTRAIGWAQSIGLKVLIDLHGAPGSQNGFDNSGHAGGANWGTGDTVSRTLTYIQRVAQGIVAWESNSTTAGVVVGLELVNEPAPWLVSGGINTIRSYYIQAYPLVRKYLSAAKYWVVIQQAFQTDWQNFMPSPTYQNVYLDMHIYHAFSPIPPNWTQTEQITATCTGDKNSVTSQTLPSFTGEWSLGTINGYSNNGLAQFYNRWGLAQMHAYESKPGNGWFFWNFKTESSTEWNYLLAVQNKWFPTLPSTETSAAACYWWCNTDCCLANTQASQSDVQSSLTFACSNGVDCSPVNQGGAYYNPNDLNHHASYAFNEWWASHHAQGSGQGCNFQGAATYCTSNCAGQV